MRNAHSHSLGSLQEARMVFTTVALLSCAGCFTPPAVFEAGTPEIDLGQFPRGTELVCLPVEADRSRGADTKATCLRGVFVSAGEEAPVVLYLPEARGSVSQGAQPGLFRKFDDGSELPLTYRMLADLQEAGFSSLFVDYRGVGPSDGSRTPRHLRRDAQVAWNEAVRRAGGDPGRVIIRAASLGTLAAATLLEDHVRPAGLVLIAPVRGETVAVHFGARRFGSIIATLCRPFLRPTVDVDLVGILRAADVPTLVIAPENDSLLPPDEAELVRAAVLANGGRFEHSGESHGRLVLSSRTLLEPERGFYSAITAGEAEVAAGTAQVAGAAKVAGGGANTGARAESDEATSGGGLPGFGGEHPALRVAPAQAR